VKIIDQEVVLHVTQKKSANVAVEVVAVIKVATTVKVSNEEYSPTQSTPWQW